MDAKAQAEGERQVMRLLVEPLKARGLARPKGFTKVKDFDLMVEKTLCPKLAYMTALNLAALEEQIAANPAGAGRDQLPIPNEILRAAAAIQEPEPTTSPLMLAVFGAPIGREAIANDWGPELLRYLKRYRKWPRDRVPAEIQREAAEARERLSFIQDREARGLGVVQRDLEWRGMREAAAVKCKAIAAQSAEVAQ